MKYQGFFNLFEVITLTRLLLNFLIMHIIHIIQINMFVVAVQLN